MGPDGDGRLRSTGWYHPQVMQHLELMDANALRPASPVVAAGGEAAGGRIGFHDPLLTT